MYTESIVGKGLPLINHEFVNSAKAKLGAHQSHGVGEGINMACETACVEQFLLNNCCIPGGEIEKEDKQVNRGLRKSSQDIRRFLGNNYWLGE